MWTDILTLAAREIKRIRREGTYWLRLISFEPDASRIYQVYVALFWLFWVFAMWAFVVEQVYLASQQVPMQDTALILEVLPFAVFLLQFNYIIYVFAKPPLKLMAPDLAYVATAPVSRSAIALVYFSRSICLPAAALALFGALIAMFFAWTLGTADPGIAGLQAFVLVFLLVQATGAAGWALALFKQRRRSAFNRRVFWLVMPLLLLGLWLAPDVFLWPGHVLVASIRSMLSPAQPVALGVTLIAAFALLAVAGSRVRMTTIIDDSQLYARIQKLGIWGQFTTADVIARIRKQSRLAKKHRRRAFLSATFGPRATLFSRTFITFARLSPGLALRLIGVGYVLPAIVITIIRFGSPEALQTWLLVFVALLYFRPNDLTRFFRECLQQPFMRQFLPENNLLLFVSQTALPLILMSAGVLLALVLQMRPVMPLELSLFWLLAVTSMIVLGLCQALEHVRLPLPKFYLNIMHYEYSVVILGALIAAAGTLTQSLWAALVASLLAVIGLSVLLYVSK